MKRLLVLAIVAMAAVSCGSKNETQKEEAPKTETPKVLVLYYSQTSNTKAVATEIATRLGADIEEIVPTKPYDEDFQATIERCKQDREQGITPEIQPLAADIAKYDVVFLGYPVWLGTYAPPVVPFCTFGSGGLESSMKDLAEAQPKAEILPGYGVRAARLEAAPKEIDQFLKASGFLEGEFVKLEVFPEQHPVNEEETAIFNAAVDGYQMLHAQAKAVASRSIPGGTEYLFTAEDRPREDNPGMPTGELKVYVTVAEGENPVFTRVVR